MSKSSVHFSPQVLIARAPRSLHLLERNLQVEENLPTRLQTNIRRRVTSKPMHQTRTHKTISISISNGQMRATKTAARPRTGTSASRTMNTISLQKQLMLINLQGFYVTLLI